MDMWTYARIWANYFGLDSCQGGDTEIIWFLWKWSSQHPFIPIQIVRPLCCIICDWLHKPVTLLKEVPGHCFSYFYETEYRSTTYFCHPQGKVYFQALSALLCSQSFGNWKKMFLHLNLVRMKSMWNGWMNCFEEYSLTTSTRELLAGKWGIIHWNQSSLLKQEFEPRILPFFGEYAALISTRYPWWPH